MSKSVLDGLAVGDIVEYRRTVRVAASKCSEVYFTDVQSGRALRVDHPDSTGSLQISMIQKAAKPHPKPGDVITGKQVKETHWKRGTVLLKKGFTFLLLASGEWQTAGSDSFWLNDDLDDDLVLQFGSLQNSAEFTVLHAPR